jgi:hypothetical protein
LICDTLMSQPCNGLAPSPLAGLSLSRKPKLGQCGSASFI